MRAVGLALFEIEQVPARAILLEVARQLPIANFDRRLANFRFDVDLFRSLVGRLLPCAVLTSFSAPLSTIKFSKGQYGRPFVTLPAESLIEFDFNDSHDSDFVACAYHYADKGETLSPIGVDVMDTRRPFELGSVDEFYKTLEDLITPRERAAYAAIETDDERKIYLTRLWAHKEAWSKATGFGLSEAWAKNSIEFSDPPTSLVNHELPAEAEQDQWFFNHFQVDDHHITVIACQQPIGSGLNVRFWSWEEMLKAAHITLT